MFVNQGRGRHMKRRQQHQDPPVNTRETILIFILVKGIDVTDALFRIPVQPLQTQLSLPSANSRLMMN